ncbi:uncharacterized protein Z518_04937 [Rhinocladiella mackenziei CBS 650.93]|uniref:Sulfatase N-terminal domain-containing protein n=1 Tax=Rhinocladiella mackenziei CBS 650.93 TaxID=1442369 RepID=A0A0D2IUY1_9EURO|nr:uncharacterized protein Z518_04937 [Rhinocladiella mackenziei CBS 650.93]KIX06961.1 hypothetical protein Z518_04937 [Rhinocladiella mackenziei CBS 650.93]
MAVGFKRPNFLIIVADDLGFSDIAPYGGEIDTPALWRLAKEGIRMTNFHTASACSPTRAMLFSGTDNHIAGLGQMAEHMRAFGDYFNDKPGYEGYLNWRVAALSEILEDHEYHTIMSGKWHLGLPKDLAPCSRGFKKNFSFLPGAGNHHGYEPQLDDGEIKIPCLNTDGHWMEGNQFIDRKTGLPDEFYSTKSFTDKLLDFLEHRTGKEKEEPFFAYLPFTAPHWPLQAPKQIVKKYAGKYDNGPDALTRTRLSRLIELGLIEEGTEHAPPVGALGKEWKDMTAEEQRISARKMEVFAAMVDIIDTNIGRVVDYLERTNELDHTFILFMSDNGAEGVALEALPMMGGPQTMGSIIEKYYDNSFENIGEANSFVWYGPRWACAATAPSRGSKCWITEGGIRCPCLIRYPPFKNAPNAITHSFTTVMDILPTILDLAGVSHPGTSFRGRTVATPRGRSWVPHLSSSDYKASTVHGEDVHVHGWELFGQRAIREGKYKAVWINSPRGKDDWELYDMDKDPAELHDLSQSEPAILKRLVDHWEVYFAETGAQASGQAGAFGAAKAKRVTSPVQSRSALPVNVKAMPDFPEPPVANLFVLLPSYFNSLTYASLSRLTRPYSSTPSIKTAPSPPAPWPHDFKKNLTGVNGPVGVSEQPYEFRAVEAALVAVLSSPRNELIEARKEAEHSASQLKLESGFAAVGLDLLFERSRRLSKIEQKARLVRDAIREVLDTDEDLAAMYLTDSLAGKPHAVSDHQEAEYMLEAYHKTADALVESASAAIGVTRKKENTFRAALAVQRNQIMFLEARLAIHTLGLAAGTLVAGLFGTNLVNYVEEAPWGFAVVTGASVILSTLFSLYGTRRLRKIQTLREILGKNNTGER